MGYFSKLTENKGIEFMDDRNKQDIGLLVGEYVHVEDFDFIHGKNGDYTVFIVEEWPSSFFFGNKVITSTFKQIEDDGMKDELRNVPMLVVERVSKNGDMYRAVEFHEDEKIPF